MAIVASKPMKALTQLLTEQTELLYFGEFISAGKEVTQRYISK